MSSPDHLRSRDGDEFHAPKSALELLPAPPELDSEDLQFPVETVLFVGPSVASREDIPFRKTGLMRYIERVFGEPIEVLLKRLLSDEELSIPQAAAELDISSASLLAWKEAFGIQGRRSTVPPELEEARLAKVRQTFQDRHDEIVTQIHAGDSDARRSQAHRNRDASSPEVHAQQVAYAIHAGEVSCQHTEKRRKDAFGDDIAGTLRRLHYTDCLTPVEIAELTRYSVFQIREFMHQYNIEDITPHNAWLEKNAQVCTLLPYLWAHPDSLEMLSHQQRHVLATRYLMEGAELPRGEIGKELGITKERVRQLEEDAIKKLKGIKDLFPQGKPVEHHDS